MDIECLMLEAKAALQQGRDERAYHLLGQALALEPHNTEIYYLLSYIAHKYKNYVKEVEFLQTCVRYSTGDLSYQVYLCRALVFLGEKSKAIDLLNSIDLNSVSASRLDLIDAIASSYNQLSLYTQASQWFEKLIELDKNNPAIWFNLGICYKYFGNFEKAKYAFEKAIDLNPNYYKAYAALVSLGKGYNKKVTIVLLKRLLKSTDDSDDRLSLSHAIAKKLEEAGEFDASFQFLILGKQKKRESIERLIEKNLEILKSIENSPILTVGKKPKQIKNIFVTGMPRSGTTLVERILSAAPTVATGGELYDFVTSIKKVTSSVGPNFLSIETIKKLSDEQYQKVGAFYQDAVDYLYGDAGALVDKLPLNVVYTPQILSALSGSVVICLDRNPLDTIVGNFKQLFSFDDGANSYSLSLTDTARYYVHFKRIIDRFSEAYGDRFYVVNYENLVNNPNSEAKKLFDFCGLPWNPNYLKIEDNTLPVATASSVQVRRKINTTSVGRWRRYDAFLTEVKSILAQAGIAT